MEVVDDGGEEGSELVSKAKDDRVGEGGKGAICAEEQGRGTGRSSVANDSKHLNRKPTV